MKIKKPLIRIICQQARVLFANYSRNYIDLHGLDPKLRDEIAAYMEEEYGIKCEYWNDDDGEEETDYLMMRWKNAVHTGAK